MQIKLPNAMHSVTWRWLTRQEAARSYSGTPHARASTPGNYGNSFD